MANPIPARASQSRTLFANNLKHASKDDILQQIFTQDVEIIENTDKKLSLKINGEIVELKPAFEKMCEKRHWFGKTLTEGAVYLALTLYGIHKGPLNSTVIKEQGFELVKDFLNKFDVELPQEKSSLERFERFALAYENTQPASQKQIPLVLAYHSLTPIVLDNKNYFSQFAAGNPYERVRILRELKKINDFPSCLTLSKTKEIANQNEEVSKEFNSYFEQKIAKEGLGKCFEALNRIRMANPVGFEHIVNTLELTKLISEKYQFKLTSFLKPNEVKDYTTTSHKLQLMERLVFNIDCIAPETQFALACAINENELSGSIEFIEKLIDYVLSINWTNIQAINLIIDSLQQCKFGPNGSGLNGRLEVKLNHTGVLSAWIANIDAKLLLKRLQSDEFKTAPFILNAIARETPQIVGEDKKLQLKLIKSMRDKKFGANPQILETLIASLAHIEWADKLTKPTLLAKALSHAVVPYMSVEQLATHVSWFTPEDQEKIALSLYKKAQKGPLHLSNDARDAFITWTSPEARSILGASGELRAMLKEKHTHIVRQWPLFYPYVKQGTTIDKPPHNIDVLYTQKFYDRANFYRQLEDMEGIENQSFTFLQSCELSQTAASPRDSAVSSLKKTKEYQLLSCVYKEANSYMHLEPKDIHYIDYKKGENQYVMIASHISNDNVKKLVAGNYSPLWDSLITDDNISIYKKPKDSNILTKLKSISVHNSNHFIIFPVFMGEILKEFQSKKSTGASSSVALTP